MGLPVAKTAEDVKNFDFAVMGVPWEGGCTYGGFSSCVVAPKTFRGVSTRYTGYLPDYDIDTFDYMTACDYGDTVVQNGNLSSYLFEHNKGIFALRHRHRVFILLFYALRHIENLSGKHDIASAANPGSRRSRV